LVQIASLMGDEFFGFLGSVLSKCGVQCLLLPAQELLSQFLEGFAYESASPTAAEFVAEFELESSGRASGWSLRELRRRRGGSGRRSALESQLPSITRILAGSPDDAAAVAEDFLLSFCEQSRPQ
jgi:hypothetical protein